MKEKRKESERGFLVVSEECNGEEEKERSIFGRLCKRESDVRERYGSCEIRTRQKTAKTEEL